ncbi:DNase I-like protein [Mycena filopes]|nr:DNase I-like protein [Mycena filopes]
MASLESSIRALLRHSDQVKVILEASVVSPAPGTPAAPVPSPDSRSQIDDPRNKRILAVVAHSDGPNTQEEGSVFVLKFKVAGRTFDQSDILRVYPVFGDFSITMAQVPRETMDSRRGSQASPSLLSLTIKQGDIAGLEPLTLCTQQVQTLRDVLAECKRLKEIAVFHTPQDLRLARKPLHTRLSTAFAGEAGDDSSDIVRIRDEWIRAQVRETGSKGRMALRVRIGTFNVNGNLPSQDLSSWVGGQVPSGGSAFIPPLKDFSPLSIGANSKDPFDDANTPGKKAEKAAAGDSEKDPDLLVLGFQELDLSTEALLYATSTFKEEAWCTAVFAALGEKAEEYEKLASKQLVGMLIVVIVRKALRPCFSDVRGCVAGTGIMGLMGNKGGTAIRMKFTPPPEHPDLQKEKVGTPGSTTLTFVNAHLAAFDEMFEKRNADFQELAKRLRFDLAAEGAPVPVTCSVFESDVLFWMSNYVDLNYRIDVPDADVRTILGSPEWKEERFGTLVQYDQLKAAVRAGKAFDMFDEGEITHLPTYRFNAGLLKDDLGYDLKRRPAWTDRVLFAANAFAPVQQLSYAGHPQITQSDHRPVSAEFVVQVDLFNQAAAEAGAERLYRQLNGLEDAHEDTNARVNLKIMDPSVDLGMVSYGKTVTKRVGIRNIGKVACAYRLVPIDVESSIHPDWLKVEPMTALLLPDELVYITLTASVDNDSAARLNIAHIDHTALDCTLILHTVMGKDHFIAVTGEYVPTCFANTLTRLTRLPGPIRALRSASELLAEDRAINAPREIMRLVNWMMAPELNLENVFVSPADPTMVDTIRECLDTGADFPFPSTPSAAGAQDDFDKPAIAIAFGETLIRLLNALPEPLVPVELHARCAEISLGGRDEAFELLDGFPPAAVNVWISVTAFLHFACQASKEPEVKTQRIAAVFAPILLRDTAGLVSPVGRRNFLLQFIQS